jgi:hypothetical protein
VPIVGAIWFTGGLVAVLASIAAPRDLSAGIAFALVITGWVASLALSLSVDGGRFARRESTNLVATRGTDPVIWLCAHLDTKSQGVSTLVRTAALLAAGTSAGVLTVLHVTHALTGGEPGLAWVMAGTLLASSAVVMMACVTGNASPGAVDNASGVVAVLSTAAGTAQSALGLVLTSAEELGLAGARAWAQSGVAAAGTRPRLIINCDTLDDEGVMRCVVHHRRDRGLAAELVAAGAAAGMAGGITRYMPGIMVDSAAFAACGLPAVTLSRATLSTLRRIHTSRDTADRLNGDGTGRVAAVMTGFIREHT